MTGEPFAARSPGITPARPLQALCNALAAPLQTPKIRGIPGRESLRQWRDNAPENRRDLRMRIPLENLGHFGGSQNRVSKPFSP